MLSPGLVKAAIDALRAGITPGEQVIHSLLISQL
jgi:hypothetical protein